MKTEKIQFGTRPDGSPSWLVRLTNSAGAYVELIDYGAIIKAIVVPDRDGNLANVALTKDSLEAFMERQIPNAAVYGRIANRVMEGRFTVGGRSFQMPIGERGNFTLHSGDANYAKRFFEAGEPRAEGDSAEITFSLRDGGEGGLEVPIDFQVTYSFTEDNRLGLLYQAVPEGDTVIAPTNHCFFNLAGRTDGAGEHLLRIDADRYTPSPVEDADPEGTLLPVEGTPLDFRSAKPLGRDLSEDGLSGYDHNFVLRGEGFREVAELSDPQSGRVMITSTDLPGVQVFTGRSLPPEFCCLETQHFPDAVNRTNFPSPIVRAGETWRSRTEYAFSVR